MKKALIITYYWPPSGGAGVQRWLKFAKYMREFGWEPVIYTPENPERPAVDHSLEKDIPENITVLKTKIVEPYSFYKRFVGRKKEDTIKSGFLSEKKNPSPAEKIAVWIRGNLFIPDARKFWITPSIKFLSRYLQQNPVDVVISTGPPHSMHLIALGLKKKLNLTWVADFRDPWTHIDYYNDLMLTRRSDQKHKALELEALTQADQVVVVSEGMKTLFKSIHNRNYHVITNGYDADDLPAEVPEPDKKFSIAHIGSMPKSRNPETLWRVLSEMVNADPEFAADLEIKLVGQADWLVLESLKNHQLEKFLNLIHYLPHDRVIEEQMKSAVLLLLINNTPNARMILTGKFFEYLAARRPILCIGPEDGDAAGIIEETGSGMMASWEEFEKTKNHIKKLYSNYKRQKQSPPVGAIEDYSRRNLSRKLIALLEEYKEN
jgi:glycosyltransferase involved in cell wall biosynthesis